MNLPLQPDLRPWSVWQRRLLTASAVVVAVVALGVVARPVREPVTLLSGRHGPDYLHTAEALIAGAEERVWLMMFVIHPGRDGDGAVDHLLASLGRARARGVDVRVLIDLGREWGTDIIDPKHERARDQLAQHGVPVLLDEIGRTTHSKILLVDDGDALLGSHNWTNSALLRNREISVHLRDPALIAELADYFRSVPGFAELRSADPATGP